MLGFSPLSASPLGAVLAGGTIRIAARAPVLRAAAAGWHVPLVADITLRVAAEPRTIAAEHEPRSIRPACEPRRIP